MTWLVTAVLPALLAQTPPAAQTTNPRTVNLAGYVYNAYTDAALAGVRVSFGSPARTTTTDAAGKFSFVAVPVGAYTLVLSRTGFANESHQVVIKKNKRIDLRIPLRPTDGSVIVITERIKRPARKQVVETTIKRDEGSQVAGTQGDVVKVVQTLGGVARARAGTSELVVWGASPSDTRLYVDDVPVPRLFHIGGSRSILASPMVTSVSLIPGGFDAAYGRAIGGMVKVSTAEPTKPRIGAFASADPIDVNLGTSARLSKSTWTSVSARTSLQNQTFDAVAPDRSKELVPLADYWDYQIKTQHQLNANDSLRILGFGVRDRVSRGIPSLTPDTAFVEDRTSTFHRIALKFERTRGAHVTSALTAWLGVDDDDTSMMFGQQDALAKQRAWRGGLRLAERRRVADWLTVRFGLDAEFARTTTTRDGALSLPPREGDITVFGQPPGDRINNDKWRTDIAGVGAYLASELRFANNALVIEPGLRFEPNLINGNRVLPVRPTEPAVGYTELQPNLDPRVRITWMPRSSWKLYAAAGRYHQSPAAGDLSPIFGSPVLEQAEALHALAGASYEPASWLRINLTGFWIRMRKLAVRSASATPGLAQVLVSDGQGRNMGGQLVVRARPSRRLFAWLTYSLMRAERRNRAGDDWRLFDVDQTHVAQAVVSYRHPSGIELGGRGQLSTGAPRTPVEGSVFNAGSGVFDPIFGAHNSIRIPAFVELSLRIAWQRTLSWGRLKVWLDVQNATNRDNAEEIIYTSDFGNRGFISGLPVLPLVGAQVNL